MTAPPRVQGATALAILVLLLWSGGASSTHARGLRAPIWQVLEFKASKLLVTAHSKIEVLPADPGEEPVLTLRSSTRMLGRESVATVRLNSESHDGIERRLIESGSRQRSKTYRFAEDHVLALRSEPANASERDLNEPKWTRRSTERIPVQRGDDPLTDPLAIFLVLSTADFGQLDSGIEIDVLSSNEVSRVRIVRTSESREVSPRHSLGTAAPDRSRQVTLRRYDVTPVAADGEFELLGLEGAIEIWVDEELRLPIEIRGRISPVGRVSVKLQRATLSDP